MENTRQNEMIKEIADKCRNNVYSKLAYARKELLRAGIKKSGENGFAKFRYFELEDFLPKTIEIFEKIGLVSKFDIILDGTTGVELAVLTIINVDNPEETITFQSPTASASSNSKNQVEIQSLGAKHTYMRRYLWLEVLELVQSDFVDATAGMPSVKQAVPAQVVEPDITITVSDALKHTLVDKHALQGKELGIICKAKAKDKAMKFLDSIASIKGSTDGPYCKVVLDAINRGELTITPQQ